MVVLTAACSAEWMAEKSGVMKAAHWVDTRAGNSACRKVECLAALRVDLMEAQKAGQRAGYLAGLKAECLGLRWADLSAA